MIPEQEFGLGAQTFTVIDKLLMIVLGQVLLHYIIKHVQVIESISFRGICGGDPLKLVPDPIPEGVGSESPLFSGTN